MMARSAEAPQHWEMFNTEAHVTDTVAELQPDIVLFQELPGLVPFVTSHAMVGANPKTHSGNLATLIKHELAPEAPKWATVGSFALSVVVGDLTVANVHLAPGRGVEDERLDQIQQIMAQRSTEALLIAGDTNTRISEEEAIGALGLKTHRPPRPTWNSKVNRFNRTGSDFSAYFSRWFVSEGVTVSKQWVGDKRRIDDASKRFYVSDHFVCGATVSTSR